MNQLAELIADKFRNGGSLIVPVIIPENAKDIFDLSKVKSGEKVRVDRDVALTFRTVISGKGEEAMLAFTDENEMRKGGRTAAVSMETREFLRYVLDSERVMGAVINPWGNSMMISREAIAAVFEAENDNC